MTPTPREVPVWPHRQMPGRHWCIEDSRPWPCPSQQYLDELVAALDDLTKAAVCPDALLNPDLDGPGENSHRNLYDWWTNRCAPSLQRARHILEGARATDDEGQR